MVLTNKYLNLGYISIIAIILGIVVSISFVNTAPAADKETIELKINGMGCEMCAESIKTLVMKCAGVESCDVSFKDGKATIKIEAGKDKEDVLRGIDERLTYPYSSMPAL